MAATPTPQAWPLLLALGWGLLGCGPSPVLRTARSGDLAAYREQLAKRPTDEGISLSEAQDIAHALLGKQIATAEGDQGKELLGAIAPCAVHFKQALEQRAAHTDELAARAALLRLDAHFAPPMSYIAKREDPQAMWRAAAARSLNFPVKDAPDELTALARAAQWRQKMMGDPAHEVRVAALQAATEAADPADTDALLAASRRDPDAEAREAAIAALGAIGTHEAVMALKDLWTRADSVERVAIVKAWAVANQKPIHKGTATKCHLNAHAPYCLAYQRLFQATETICDDAALEAAFLLPEHSDGQTTAVIERCIDDGSQRIRVKAIEGANIQQRVLRFAIGQAAEDDDPRVASAALARLTELGGDKRTAALKRLRELAASPTTVATEVLPALVQAGVLAAVPLLTKDVAAPDATTRRRVGQDFAQLLQLRRALHLLGDEDASVRGATGCAILSLGR